MIRVTRIDGDGIVSEDFSEAKSWSEQNGMLILFRTPNGTAPIIGFASGVWLSVEAI